MPSKFHNSKGFTLLELLVVISIIGLMASIVLVSLDITREKAVVAKGLQFGSSIYHAHGDELVGFWNFNETGENTCSGGEDACDSSGFGNHGTFQNGAAHNDDSPNSALGRSVSFNNDYIDCGNDESLSIPGEDELTIEAWIFPLDISAQRNTIISNAPWGGWNKQYYLHIQNGQIFYLFTNAGCSEWYETSLSPAIINLNQWHHIAITDLGYNEVYFYVNGQKYIPNRSAPFGDQSKPASGFSNTVIGRYRPDAPHYFDGKIDEVRIYKTALSAAEIQKHYAEGAERRKIVKSP